MSLWTLPLGGLAGDEPMEQLGLLAGGVRFAGGGHIPDSGYLFMYKKS